MTIGLQQSELDFWQGIVDIYPLMKLGYPYRQLVKRMGMFINPQPNQIWLDAGSGPAEMSQVVWDNSKRSLQKIIALDIVLSPMSEKKKEKIPVLELKLGSLCERLEFPDDMFDGIISNIAIPYIIEFEGIPRKEGIKKLFKEFSRILKSGGQLVWSVPKPNMHVEIIILGAALDVMWNLPKIPHLLEKTKKLLSYGKELERKGLEGLYTYLYPEEWNKILSEAGFINHQWSFVFWHQTWVNSSIKT